MVSWILGGGWLIILGAFFIAIGGVWTTQGWRNLNARAEKKALIIAVAQECLVTQDSFRYPPITISDDFKLIGSRHNKIGTATNGGALSSIALPPFGTSCL